MSDEPIDVEQLMDIKHTAKPQDRLTAVLQMHHERQGINPTSVAVQFACMLNNRKQPYVRHIDDFVPNKPQPLDFGWLKREMVGYVVFENRTPLIGQTNPTEEERLEHKNKYLYVVTGAGKWEVPPGECAVGKPTTDTEILLQVTHPDMMIVITAYPR